MMAIQTDMCVEMLVNLAPEQWTQWITGLDDIIVRDFIHVPCRWLKSARDILIQVKSRRRGEFIVLNRWQLRYRSGIGDRITASAAMAREKYRLPVYPVLINILRPCRGTVIGSSFQSRCLELTARQDCRTINLWDLDVETAFNFQAGLRLQSAESLTPLLPFAPVMRGGNDKSVLQRAAIALEAENGFEELLELLAIFGTFALGVDLVEEVMNLQVEALRASPLARELKQIGRQEGTLEILNNLIEWRFGFVPKSLEVILPSLAVEELEKLAKRLFEAKSLNEFIASI